MLLELLKAYLAGEKFHLPQPLDVSLLELLIKSEWEEFQDSMLNIQDLM